MLGKKLNIHIVRYLFIIILICNFSIGKGQNVSTPDNSLQTQAENPLKIHSPHKATMYSAMIPGLGQIYNKKYWKLPIIYGLTGVFIYAFDFNNDQYNKYRIGYADIIEGNIENFEGYTEAQVLRLKDNYRRNRDLNVIVLAGIYILNVVDATVDAHLFDYDISEDLSLNIQPAIQKTFDNQNALGVSCSFSF